MKQLHFDERLPPVEEVFRGIDEHLVLVYHIVQKRIPASFGPTKDGVVSKNPRREQTNSAPIVYRNCSDARLSLLRFFQLQIKFQV